MTGTRPRSNMAREATPTARIGSAEGKLDVESPDGEERFCKSAVRGVASTPIRKYGSFPAASRRPWLRPQSPR